MLADREIERDSTEEKTKSIFLNESLTPNNRLLLKEAKKKKKSKEKEYHFTGYTVNVQVRVRKDSTSEPISIINTMDLQKIVWTQ